MPDYHTPGCEDALAFICDSPWGFAELDSKHQFVWLNNAFCEILNAPFELIVGKEIESWVHQEDRSILKLKMEQMTGGEVGSLVLSIRYIQRGSIPQRQLVIWGILSIQSKWDSTTGSYSGSRVTFRQYDPIPEVVKWNLTRTKQFAYNGLQWLLVNWRTVITVAAVAASLMAGSSGKLYETLQRAKDTKTAVDSALDSLSPGASQPQSLPLPPTQP